MLRRRLLIGSCLALLLLAGGAIAAFFIHRSVPIGVEIGMLAPDFTLRTFDGEPISLSQFRGRVVLLEFWQSTCPDCRRETPYLDRLYMTYKDRGLVWLGVNLDHDHDAAREYLEENGFSEHQITLGESFTAAMEVVSLLDVPLVPYVIVIDKRGIIRYKGVYPEEPTAPDIEPWL